MASVYERAGRYYARYKDPSGRWRLQATAAKTNRDALRLAVDLERHAERVRHGLEPLPSEGPVLTFGQLYEWWWTDYGTKRRGRHNDDNDKFNR